MITYTLVDDGGANRYSPLTRSNVRARMLTKTEANALGCKDTSSNSCPSYLYINTSNSNTELSPNGYWLSSAYSLSVDSGWYLFNFGQLHYTFVGNGTLYNGVRPVILYLKLCNLLKK